MHAMKTQPGPMTLDDAVDEALKFAADQALWLARRGDPKVRAASRQVAELIPTLAKRVSKRLAASHSTAA